MTMITRILPMLALLLIASEPAAATAWAGYGRTQISGKYVLIDFTYGYPSEENPDYLLPCTGGSNLPCRFGVGTMAVGFGGFVSPEADPSTNVTYQDGERLGAVRQRLIAKLGVSGQITTPNWLFPTDLPKVDWDTLCAGFQYWPTGGGRGELLPGSICGRIPPPEQHCDPLPDLLFDYGPLTVGQIEGAELTREGSLTCTNVQSVSLRMMSPLVLGPGLTATILLDGQPLDEQGTTIDVPDAGRALTFTSRLSGSGGGSVGEMSASSVLLVEIL